MTKKYYESEFTPLNEILKQCPHPDILLGNGFAIRHWENFHYSSLFEEFVNSLSVETKSFFESFQTNNFEEINRKLSDAIEVNQKLGIDNRPIEGSLEKLKSGFRDIIQRIHPSYEEIPDEAIDKDITNLSRFRDIYTLNYDILTYHAIMKAQDKWDGEETPPTPSIIRPYNDFFWGKSKKGDLEFRDYQNYEWYRHIFYLHGALFIFPGFPTDIKQRRKKDKFLLDSVSEKIIGGDVPLLVNEGHSEYKVNFMNRSPYLNFAYNNFKSKRNDIVIYGARLGEEDEHIVEALNGRNGHIIYSVYCENKDEKEIVKEVNRIKAKIDPEKLFFVYADEIL